MNAPSTQGRIAHFYAMKGTTLLHYKLQHSPTCNNLSLECGEAPGIVAWSFLKIIIFDYRNIPAFSDYLIRLQKNQSLFWKGRDR
jgi:hypothetical protein